MWSITDCSVNGRLDTVYCRTCCVSVPAPCLRAREFFVLACVCANSMGDAHVFICGNQISNMCMCIAQVLRMMEQEVEVQVEPPPPAIDPRDRPKISPLSKILLKRFGLDSDFISFYSKSLL